MINVMTKYGDELQILSEKIYPKIEVLKTSKQYYDDRPSYNFGLNT